ncbi:hypothetical protein VTJ04DRAFT_6679 [Mycothermus thermophilus]|uniref:uncharacterized protein n=1 Tax=Humicola insolens TaxID=85995 RepID=UPI0037444CAB
MAVQDATQALVAAFFFGIVLNAASAALVLYFKGYGLSTLFRDSQRLVLVLFLLSAALWAQSDFVSILLDVSTSSTPCQIGIIFSTVFDQLARFSIEQFLLWAFNNNNGAKLSVFQLVPQALILARFAAGAVFAGFTRPQTDSFCVPTTAVLPVGIAVAGLDGAIVFLLFVRVWMGGVVAGDRGRALMAVLVGLALWTGTSVPLLLGIDSLALATRTALPAAGLLALIVSVTAGAGVLTASRTTTSRRPEAPSPRRFNISRDISTSDSDAPPSRYEDLKDAAIRSSTTFINPREVPRAKDETVVMSSSELARRLDKLTSSTPKKGLAGGKFAISNPILQANSEQNPLSKIPVVDLQAAAAAEKERRARAMEAELAAQSRPAGPTMGMAPEEIMKRAVSVKRKEVVSVSAGQTAAANSLQPPQEPTVGVTTSARLSPGPEDGARRRSPRPTTPPQEPVQPRQKSPTQSVESTSSSRRSIDRPNRPLTAIQPLLKTDIRPSRKLPSPKAPPPPEPAKTPLQRRPTIGLPSNPRAKSIKVPEEPGAQHRTVLFLNNIEYDDPAFVETIIKTAGNPPGKRPPPPAETQAPATAKENPTARSASILNRPRPIPRKPADSPADVSPALRHRRSRSGGSLFGKKSVLSSTAGSPTRLPPLPALPKTAELPARPHPNDTKSMTFEEKVTLLFPAPPSGNGAKRRSTSVPDVPVIPVSYFEIDTPARRTTNTSFRTESMLEVDEIPRQPDMAAVNAANEAKNAWVSAFEGKTAQQQEVENKRRSSGVFPRASAWTETSYDRTEDDTTTNWSSVNSPEYAVAAPVIQGLAPASIQMARRPTVKDANDARPAGAENRDSETLPIVLDTASLPRDRNFQAEETAAKRESTVLPPAEETKPAEEEPAKVQAESTPKSRTPPPEMPTWHRRVGEECPKFSDKRENRKSKKLTPPAPLPLHRISTTKILAIQVEPSPLESPGQAVAQIQAQLKNLDNIGQGSPGSAARRQALLEDLEREMGQQAEHWQEIKHDMGRDSMSSMQTTSTPANVNSQRTSLASTINIALGSDAARQSIGANRRSSFLDRIRGNNSNNNNNLEVPPMPSNRDSGSPGLTRQLSKWQKRLTEAQMEYMDAKLLRESRVSFMQLARAQLASPTPPESDNSDEEVEEPVPAVPKEFLVEQQQQEQTTVQVNIARLWTPPEQIAAATTGLLWTPPPPKPAQADAPLPALSVRLPQRKGLPPLTITSTELWRKPYVTTGSSATGLWRPRWASAAPPAQVSRTPSLSAKSRAPAPPPPKPRPVTQRPPRRSRRITMLPDILESPEPLPNKRGTLGIFQFPWGEKSDTATIPPPQPVQRSSMWMAMPGTMTTGGPAAMAMAMGIARPMPAEEGYESSFFDEYDDEEMEMDSDEMGSEEGDDDFDETTLWEIASLLKTDAVPTKQSLFGPTAGEEVVEDESSEDEDGPSQESIVIALAEPRELLLQNNNTAAQETITVAVTEVPEKTTPPPAARIGLPANPRPAMNLQAAVEVQAIPQEPEKPQGSLLWTPPTRVESPVSRGGLFAPGAVRREEARGTSEEPVGKNMTRTPRPAVEDKPLEQLPASSTLWEGQTVKRNSWNWILAATKVDKKKQGSGLWRPNSRVGKPRPRSGGLFTPGAVRREEPRGTEEEPAARNMIRRPRPVEDKPLERLTSSSLWEGRTAKRNSWNWILGQKQHKQGSGSSGLWRPNNRVGKPRPRSGLLFTPGAVRREEVRGTDEEPVAKYMTRRPRAVVEDKPLESLTSSNLWENKTVKRTSWNWLLARKPHDDKQQGSSGLWSPSSRVGTEPRPHSSGLLFTPGQPALVRGSTEEPAAKYMTTRKPRKVVEQEPLAKLTSTGLWQAPVVAATVTKSVERNWILAGKQATSTSTSTKIQRIKATPADWKAALDEALRLSYPRLPKPKFTPADWQAALEEALRLSYPAKSAAPSSSFDAALKHPVFAASSLITRAEWFHPAATGYTYDVANVHPVFFGSLAITCPEEAVHPAISAYASRKLRRQRSRERRAARKENRERSRSRSVASRERRSARKEEEVEAVPTVLKPDVYVSAASAKAIEARIEALEQERLFVERAAREEYRRRTSMMMSVAEPAPAPEPVDMMMMPAGMEAVQTLQRHLSWHIRQSLVLPKEEKQEVVKVARSNSRREKSAAAATKPVAAAASSTVTTTSLLWTPSTQPKQLPTATSGLWTPSTSANRTTTATVVEDAYTETQRLRRRRQTQKRQRRQEILAQIAAVEQGLNPFVDFKAMGVTGLWDRRERRREVRRMTRRGADWLHAVCVREEQDYEEERRQRRESRRRRESRLATGESEEERKGRRVVLRY